MEVIAVGNQNSPFYNSEIQKKYLDKFVKLRYDVFTTSGRNHYTIEPDSYDLHPDSCFVYFVENNEVVGGRTIVVHKPNSGMTLKTEKSIPIKISEVYPNLNVHNLTYAEIGGLCFHPSIRKQNLSEKIYEFTFSMLQQLNCDFFVSEPVPTNVDRVIRHSELNNVKQIVPHTKYTSLDGFGDYRIFMSFKDKDEIDLTTGNF